MKRNLFVTGTGTGVGKTVLSALLTAALDAAYWKPIQTGRQGGRSPTDREAVMRWAEIGEDRAIREAYVFDPPVSPHLAARDAGISIAPASLCVPGVERRVIIEGAGGVLVPINDRELMADLIVHLGAPVVIAAATTLGTINHTLLTVDAARGRRIEVAGVVLLGEENRDNRESIERYGGVPVIGWIPPLPRIERRALLAAFRDHFDREAFQ